MMSQIKVSQLENSKQFKSNYFTTQNKTDQQYPITYKFNNL